MSSEAFCTRSVDHYSEEQLASLEVVPTHVAIIMDGNRRWARRQLFSKVLNPFDGHWEGANTLNSIVEASTEVGISYLTAYAFSTENWKRSPEEVKTLMKILVDYLQNQRRKMVSEGVRFETIGDLTPFDQEVRDVIDETISATKKGKTLRLTLALNYGARDEMRRAMVAMAEDYKEGKIEIISEQLLSRYLDTGHLPDPDFLIRTSGEMRFSNFLLWQIAYTEVYVTSRLWPEFTPRDYLDALYEYQKRERRGGK
ncbi:MAG: Ditrans,polycis-undecaprenyl-diphosphate synthase ((2E,6E)-farnesyl-diphosphate specific) [Chlamydiales bacterium]|nr:Ditrans,polycis-undecaprenyl-diphosphate synthase ((2E,6E)-farnesyl-diphosphate specific) [Chlamydiales bacterium]MCH9619336.1 Ditrans,polycis-undecaprenyl-diphosphate synthase ((2E,6E)-farnesyl-diphosphate specific) [Chlamydiales bacterium]MCH9622140.1 Ditrans,polycis-undecaprenyl-diphosphate synthase ((2E,6E)-farnesyl-diphosphate specific) [Chlamydiales bacterium]